MTNIETYLHRLDWNRAPQGLYAPIAYTLEAGGKRLRPTLTLLANEMFGGREEDVVPAALALEVFHNFTLLHDDLMDNASVRRGRPAVHVRWNVNTAILSGDQMLIEAYALLAKLPESKLPTVLRWFNRMATEICEGQQYDVDFEQKEDVNLDDYLMMIRLKTSVLLATALKIGAYMGGAEEHQQEALYQYGIHIGLAFQIQDDILDVYGDPKTFGKAIGGDILCGKKTYMLLTAFQHADAATKKHLTDVLYDATVADEAKIHAVTDIYNRLNVRSVCEQVMAEHTQQALQILDTLPQNAATQQLRQLAEQLIVRQS